MAKNPVRTIDERGPRQKLMSRGPVAPTKIEPPYRDDYETVKAALDLVTAENARLREAQQNGNAGEPNAKLVRDLQEARSTIEKANAEIAELEDTIADLEAELDAKPDTTLKDENTRLKERVRDLEKGELSVRALEEECGMLRDEAEKLKNKVRYLESMVDGSSDAGSLPQVTDVEKITRDGDVGVQIITQAGGETLHIAMTHEAYRRFRRLKPEGTP